MESIPMLINTLKKSDALWKGRERARETGKARSVRGERAEYLTLFEPIINHFLVI